jgi:hypothetical protein
METIKLHFVDVFNRKVVGWEVFTRESAEQAATVRIP